MSKLILQLHFSKFEENNPAKLAYVALMKEYNELKKKIIKLEGSNNFYRAKIKSIEAVLNPWVPVRDVTPYQLLKF